MRFVTHEEDGFEVSTKNHNKVIVPAKTLEFPQVDSTSEFTEFCGGEEKAVELINDLLYSRSKNGALAIVRNAPADQTVADAIARAQQYSKGYNPAQERVSKAAVLEGVDKLRTMKDDLKSMSQEDLLALLESTLKI
jgi:hypothetical protein